MSNFNILTYPNDLLQKKADKFDFDNPVIPAEDLEKALVENMNKYGGIGLAATQLGINARAFAMGDSHKVMVLFNPEITEVSEETHMLNEGCLSFPGVSLYVERPVQMHVTFQDKERKVYNYWVKGLDCHIIAHEMDHLDGITMKDRVSKLKWDRAKKKLKV